MNRATQMMDMYMGKSENVEILPNGNLWVKNEFVDIDENDVEADITVCFEIMPTEDGYQIEFCTKSSSEKEGFMIEDIQMPITSVAQVVSIFGNGEKVIADIEQYTNPQDEIAQLKARLAELEGRA